MRARACDGFLVSLVSSLLLCDEAMTVTGRSGSPLGEQQNDESMEVRSRGQGKQRRKRWRNGIEGGKRSATPHVR